MGDRRTLRRRWLAAGLVSLAAHGLVFLGLSLTPREGPPAPPLPVLITLERPQPPTPARARTPTTTRPSAQPIQVHQPPAQPTAVPGSGVTPSVAPPSAVRGAPGPPAPQQAAVAPLKLDCLNLGPAARTSAFGREDCEVRKYKKLPEGQAGYDVPENPAWEAAIAAKQSVHRPLPPEKPFHGDCANSNLGMGCPGDMLVPLVKRKF